MVTSSSRTVCAAEGNDLIQSRHGIAHAAAAGKNDLFQRGGADLDLLRFRNRAQTLQDQRILDKLEAVLLASGEDRGRDLVVFRGGQ